MKNDIYTKKYNSEGTSLRSIRSFVSRSGRITKSQLTSIVKYWSLFGVDFQFIPINFCSLFKSTTEIILEIGFGTGQSLVDTAKNFPEKNFLGIEVYKSGIGSCLKYAFISQITNLRVIYHDAVEVFDKMIVDYTLSIVQVFFPDPWHKKRHHKRRLLKKNFIKKIFKKLKKGGVLHIATDSESYALYILEIMNCLKLYKNLSKNNDFVLRPVYRPVTKFEKKGFLRGNKVFDLMFKTI